MDDSNTTIKTPPVARPSAGRPPAAFQQKTPSKNIRMRIYSKINIIMCFPKKTSVVRPSAGRPPVFCRKRFLKYKNAHLLSNKYNYVFF